MKKTAFVNSLTSILMLLCLLLCSCDNAAENENSDKSGNISFEESCSGSGETFPAASEIPATTEESGISEEPEVSDVEPQKETTKIAVFGDSIAYGYGLTDRESEAFPFLLTASLRETGKSFECENYAVNGHTSADMQSDISAADGLDENTDIVLISIGANNLLGTAIATFSAVASSDVRFAPILDGSASPEQLIAILSQMGDALKEAFTSDAFRTAALTGIAQLRADIPSFIAHIRAKAPNAKLYYQTVYNPYKGVRLMLSDGSVFDFSKMCDEYIVKLNGEITENAAKLNYTLVDVYSAFESSDARLVNCSLSGDGIPSIDPHPNAAGHKLIAALYGAALMS